MVTTREILFVAYGGGHMRMLVPVAREMQARGHAVRLLPLTVGITDARASGLPMTTLTETLADHPDLSRFHDLGGRIAPASGHPAVSDAETRLYHGIGLADLISGIGEAAAMERWRAETRAAFLPVRTWAWLLDRLAPRALVATTAPRSERAALEAARAAGIPSVCVTDHFLVYEMDYVSRPGHGDRICVLGEAVAATLADHGRPAGEIRFTGNPAFDELFEPAHAEAARDLREARGWHGKRVILWPQESGTVQVRGKPLYDNPPIQAQLDKVLMRDPDSVLVIRPHPNRPVSGTATHPQVVIDSETPVAVMVRAADLVFGQCTTVCLQAALSGVPVVTLGNGDMPPFACYGLARDLERLEDIPEALTDPAPPDAARLGAPRGGTAATRVADVIEEGLQDARL